jgi:probable phosphoglycerate mutase
VQGTLDVPLCEDGRQEVERMVEELRSQPISAIYRSPCQSAAQTAEALSAALNVKAKTVDKLQNVNQGLWQGLLVDEVKTKQPRVYRQWQEQPETVCPPQGETLGAARQRVQAALSKLLKKHKSDGLVAIVTPEPLASVIRNVLGQGEWGDLWHCANSDVRWQLIDVPEAVEAK